MTPRGLMVIDQTETLDSARKHAATAIDTIEAEVQVNFEEFSPQQLKSVVSRTRTQPLLKGQPQQLYEVEQTDVDEDVNFEGEDKSFEGPEMAYF